MLIRSLWVIRNYFLKVLQYPGIGARALVVKGDEVLLIRHTYESGWFTIGGAVDKKETFMALLRFLLVLKSVLIEVRVISTKTKSRGKYDIFYSASGY